MRPNPSAPVPPMIATAMCADASRDGALPSDATRDTLRVMEITALIELGVGIVCVAGAAGAWRIRRARWLAVLLGVAGVAACASAVSQLAT